MIRGDQLVTVGRGFAEARTNNQQQVGIANALLKLWVGPIPELPGIYSAIIADRVLAAEGGGSGDAVAPSEGREMMRCIAVPSRTPNDCDGAGRVLQQAEHGLHRPGAWGLGKRCDLRPVDRLDLIAEHVFGESEDNRSRPAGGGDAEGA